MFVQAFDAERSPLDRKAFKSARIRKPYSCLGDREDVGELKARCFSKMIAVGAVGNELFGVLG